MRFIRNLRRSNSVGISLPSKECFCLVQCYQENDAGAGKHGECVSQVPSKALTHCYPIATLHGQIKTGYWASSRPN